MSQQPKPSVGFGLWNFLSKNEEGPTYWEFYQEPKSKIWAFFAADCKQMVKYTAFYKSIEFLDNIACFTKAQN